MFKSTKIFLSTVAVLALTSLCGCETNDDVTPLDKKLTPTTPISGESDLGTWSSGSPMPTSRRGISNMTIEHNGLIYVFGGISKDAQITNSLEIYNIKEDSWSKGQNIPLKTWRASVAKHNDKIYLIGGYTTLNKFPYSPTNRVFEYDPKQNTWTEKAPMLTRRGSALALYYNDRIHVLGGANKGALKSHEVYDPSSDSWTETTPMLEERSGLTGLVYRGNMYIMGGYRLTVYGAEIVNSSMEHYNGFADFWKKGVDLPVERKGMDATLLNNKIYVFGGDLGGNVSLTLVLDPATNEWKQLAEMPTPVSFMGVSAYQNAIYVLGGSPITRDNPESINTNRKFTPPE